jgi:hypothetical protein
MTESQNYFLMMLAAVIPACAAAMPQPKAPTAYSCDDAKFVDDGRQLNVVNGPPASVGLGWADDEGRHYVRWPTSVTDKENVEYVIPNDRFADAVVHHYDTRQGSAKQDWLLMNSTVCPANGGYSDALTRFAHGDSIDDIQKALSLVDKTEARKLVYEAMIKLQRRYWKDR